MRMIAASLLFVSLTSQLSSNASLSKTLDDSSQLTFGQFVALIDTIHGPDSKFFDFASEDFYSDAESAKRSNIWDKVTGAAPRHAQNMLAALSRPGVPGHRRFAFLLHMPNQKVEGLVRLSILMLYDADVGIRYQASMAIFNQLKCEGVTEKELEQLLDIARYFAKFGELIPATMLMAVFVQAPSKDHLPYFAVLEERSIRANGNVQQVRDRRKAMLNRLSSTGPE